MDWKLIETAPKDGTPIILANFDAECLLTGAPHVWTARWVSQWEDVNGNVTEDENPHFCECSFAATNENGMPTHWISLPNRCRVNYKKSGEAPETWSGGSQGFVLLEEAEAFAEGVRAEGYSTTIEDYTGDQPSRDRAHGEES